MVSAIERIDLENKGNFRRTKNSLEMLQWWFYIAFYLNLGSFFQTGRCPMMWSRCNNFFIWHRWWCDNLLDKLAPVTQWKTSYELVAFLVVVAGFELSVQLCLKRHDQKLWWVYRLTLITWLFLRLILIGLGACDFVLPVQRTGPFASSLLKDTAVPATVSTNITWGLDSFQTNT